MTTDNRMTTAVAALLYNSIFDLGPNDGAWTPDQPLPRDDQTPYLAFASALISAHTAHPEAKADAIIETARQHTKAPLAWNSIMMDDKQSLLTEQCGLAWHEIAPFLDEPNPLYMEYEFIAEDEGE